jgi:hypothetical protein
MAWEARGESPLAAYLSDFDALMGDRRTGFTFRETTKGIIAAGSLICKRIAAHSQVFAATSKGGQRIIRLAKGESTQRSQLDVASQTARLRSRGPWASNSKSDSPERTRLSDEWTIATYCI